MQDPRSTSTLELVINEQQMQNMSQVDLSRPEENLANSQQQQQESNFFKFEEWPSRVKESFSAKIEEAKSESNSNTEFIFKLIQLFSGTAVWLLCFFCTIIMPVILFFLGLLSLDSCPDYPSLPYLVFATGFTMSASNLFNLAFTMDLPILTNHSILSADVKNTIASIINIMFNCVVAFLYIICAHRVFSINKLDGDNASNGGDTLQCSYLLYGFTFWFVYLTISMFGFLIIVGGLLFAYNKYRSAIIRGSTPRSQQTTSNNVNTNPASPF